MLFRASHHSILLEAELARANIPFHKYGGLKFVETAHVKDLMAFLRLAENPRDVVSGCGFCPCCRASAPQGAAVDGHARRRRPATSRPGPTGSRRPPPRPLAEVGRADDRAGRNHRRVARAGSPRAEVLRAASGGVLRQSAPRLRDLEQLEQIASRYRSRQRMLPEMTLDPPTSTQDLAGPPRLDDDYLVLSTIHSAKGLEWDAVYVIHAADGNIPSDMATGRRGDRGRAAAVLRGPDAGEDLALRLFSAAILLARPQRPPQLFPAHPLPPRRQLLKCFEQCVTDSRDEEWRRLRRRPRPAQTSRSVRRRTKDFVGATPGTARVQAAARRLGGTP